MRLNDLLAGKNIDPARVLVLRHRPHEPELNKVLPWLAAERPDTVNAYQQTQAPKLQGAMTRAAHVASFIRYRPAQALFVGLYWIEGSRPITQEEFWKIPAYREMREKFGVRGFDGDDGRTSKLFFDLRLTDFYPEWKGKLVVGWPPPERSWWRLAHRNEIAVRAILEDSALDQEMPPWNEIVLTSADLSVLPNAWCDALQHWRGIYYIRDASDGKSYVGAAYGRDNILGRWRLYAASGHGGNRLLRMRDPRQFQFSVLERVSPDMPDDEVIAHENTWKERLHTRAPDGLNDN